ncbi:MAG: imidazoleglycerol-phosphate dehydratase, partial [Candidatus Raymondbacteria bacterium RifOxyC12_full_50_8]
LCLDGTGAYEIDTGIGFFDHMLSLFAKHGSFDFTVKCRGDLQVDAHHSVEDVGICLGDALTQALGDKKGIARYGSFSLPMDEALASTVIDLGGRPFFVLNGTIPSASGPGHFSTELVDDFFKALSDTAKCNLHITLEYGRNSHHCIEAMFKSFSRALSAAVKLTGNNDIPSTKGIL